MSKFDDIKNTIKKMLNKSRGENEKIDDDPSMIEGEESQIFGVRRGIVIAIACGLVVIFFLAIWWSFDNTTENKKQVYNDTSINKQADQVNRNEFPDDYANLAKHDKKNNPLNSQLNTNGQQQINQQVRTPINNQNMAMQRENMDLPQITPRNYSQMYQPYPTYQGYGMPIQQQQLNQQNQEKEKEEKYNSAIAFALGNGNANANNQNESSGSDQQEQAMMSYVPISATTIQAGTIIPAILMTGINSDVGGQVIAQVQENIYDSMNGYNLLIPAGSRVIGNYSGGAQNGQNRIEIKWNTLLFPGGGSYAISDSMIAIDGAGYAGLVGNVNNHTSKMLSAGAFTSALAALGGVAAGNTSSSNNYTTGELAAQGAMSNLLNTASSLFQKNMNIQPTITIQPGYQFNIFVTNSIFF